MSLSITLQPGQSIANRLFAAYRPIVFEVTSNEVYPIVYCDVYFNGTYYKSLSKTVPNNFNGTNQVFQFDISDSAQEFLRCELAENGGSEIVAVPVSNVTCTCKFRYGIIDGDGFLEQQTPIPVQATSSSDAESGGGVESFSFTILNVTLQHQNNQNLATHLNAYKNGTWESTSYPLTHRPNQYKLCRTDSDYFPIVSEGEPTCLRLNYRLKGEADFQTADYCTPCDLYLQGLVSFPVIESGDRKYEVVFDMYDGDGNLIEDPQVTIQISLDNVTWTPVGVETLEDGRILYAHPSLVSGEDTIVPHYVRVIPSCGDLGDGTPSEYHVQNLTLISQAVGLSYDEALDQNYSPAIDAPVCTIHSDGVFNRILYTFNNPVTLISDSEFTASLYRGVGGLPELMAITDVNNYDDNAIGFVFPFDPEAPLTVDDYIIMNAGIFVYGYDTPIITTIYPTLT